MLDNSISLSIEYIGLAYPFWDNRNAHCAYECKIETPSGRMSLTWHDSLVNTVAKRHNKTEEIPPDYKEIFDYIRICSYQPELTLKDFMIVNGGGEYPLTEYELKKAFNNQRKEFLDVTRCFTQKQLCDLEELLEEE